jgi:uncharacterized membrane protein
MNAQALVVPFLAHVSGGAWFMHMLVSSVVHVAVWHLLSPLFRALGPVGSVILALAVIFLGWKVTQRSRA